MSHRSHRRPSRRTRARGRAGVPPAAVLAAGALPAALALPAGAQDLRYSVTPTAQQVTWNSALGLDNALLYGGRLGVVFGRRIELQGHYLTNQGTDARVRDLYDRLNVTQRPPQNPGLDVRNYGASVVYNFTLGGVTPFLRGGGSVLRLEPEGGRRSDRIALSYGGGLRFGKPGGVRFNVFAEDLRFRVDRTLLLALPAGATPPPADVDANRLRSNLVYGAGLSVPLGGGAVTYDDTPQYQLGNVALPVDVFAARQTFAAASGVPRQNALGVRTGIDFGPLVGLRAFYWRGVNDNFNATQGVQSYGAEAQFALNAGPGVNPFLIAGAGQVDFLDSYRRGTAPGGVPLPAPRDQTALIVGGGVKIPVGARFVLTGSARNYLAALDRATQNVAEASQLQSNWQYSVGLSFGIGGRGARRQTAARPRADTVFVDRETGRRLRDEELATTRVEERERVVERYAVTARGDTVRGGAVDSVLAADRDARLVEVRRASAAGEVVDATRDGRRARAGGANGYASDRTVQVVVPAEGEIILRYGPQRGAAGGAGPAGAAPARAFVREFRERDGRVVREFREGDGTLSREFTDDRGRPIREYREPSGRVVREYITVPTAAGGTVVVPQYGAPAPQYVPGYGPSTVTVIPGTSAAPAPVAPPPPTGGLAPAAVPQDGPRYVPGYEPSGYAPAAGGAPDAARDVVAKDPLGAAAAPGGRRARLARDPRTDARIAARLDSLERVLAARDAEAGRAPSGASQDDVRAIVREELARAERERAAVVPAPTTVVTRPGAPASGTVRVVQAAQPVYYGTGVQGGLLYSGATVTNGTQALLGVRLDFGPVAPTLGALRLVPELAVGAGGGGTSTYVAANALYETRPLFRLRPRVSLGAGLLNFSAPVGSRDGLDLVVTPAYGVSLPFGAVRRFGPARTPELLVEHQGVGLFDVNRVVVGVGWRR